MGKHTPLPVCSHDHGYCVSQRTLKPRSICLKSHEEPGFILGLGLKNLGEGKMTYFSSWFESLVQERIYLYTRTCLQRLLGT